MLRWAYCFLFIVYFVVPVFTQQQSIDSISIRNIFIENTKRTKDFVIRRELTVSENQKIASNELDSIILVNRLNVFNLRIFNDVNFNIKNWENDSLDLIIKIREKWTLIPVPILKTGDRNINEWWKQYNHDFSRIQYGLKFNWFNFTGRNDVLQFALSFGLQQMFELGYLNPSINRKRNIGFGTYFSYIRSRRIPVNTIYDKLSYPNITETFHYNHFQINSSFFYRPNTSNTHVLKVGHSFTTISDSVLRVNTDYFINNKNTQNYLKIGYLFEADHRDIRAYPYNGWFLQAALTNYGLFLMDDINLTTFSFRLSNYNQWKSHPKLSVATFGKMMLSLPQQQPYNIQDVKSLGYDEDLVRGYELYVLNGQHYLLFKTEERFRAIDFRIKNLKKVQSKPIMNKSLAYLPINLIIKTYFDAAYVWDKQFHPTNALKNKWIFGFGAGLDLVTFNNSVFRLEYSFNRSLENRVYLHFQQAL